MPTKLKNNKRRFHFKLFSLINRYLLAEVFRVFLGAALFILFILMMFQIMRLAEYLIVHSAPIGILLRITFFMLISFLPAALPVAFLIAILVAFSRLSADSEIIALKASGLSQYQLCQPITLLALLVSLLSWLLNMYWVPWGEASLKSLILKLGNTKMTSQVQAGAFTDNFFNLLVFADKVDTEKNKLERVFIYDEREAKSPLTYVAQEAEIIPVPSLNELDTSILFQLKNGSIHQNQFKEQSYQKTDFKTYSLYLKVEEAGDGLVQKPQMIPYKDLQSKIQTTEKNTIKSRELRSELWRRINNALSPWVFLILGVGFGSFSFRTAKVGVLFLAFMITLTFWILQVIGLSLSQRGEIPPELGPALSNIILFIIGILKLKQTI